MPTTMQPIYFIVPLCHNTAKEGPVVFVRHAKLGIVCSTIPLCKVGAEITGEATRVVCEAVQRAEVHNEVFEGATLNASTICTPGNGVRIGVWVDKGTIPSKPCVSFQMGESWKIP